MSDLISRQDTLKRLCEKCTEGYEKAVCGARKCTEYQVIEDMPSADRPTGKWIDMSNGRAIRTPWWESGKCDQCGKYGSKTWDYCPHCGAKMEVEDERFN